LTNGPEEAASLVWNYEDVTRKSYQINSFLLVVLS
jgi:hypothetical protein